MSILKVGDTVNWRAGFGVAAPERATVIGIDEVQPGEKYGDPVEGMAWDRVARHAVVSLDTGNWAYGRQISPV